MENYGTLMRVTSLRAFRLWERLSWFSLIIHKAMLLVSLTRFPAFVWPIAADSALPRTVPARSLKVFE